MPFNYFGRKARIAGRYPRPDHDTIIEPFAGSAAYSMHSIHWLKRVILIEKHPDIAALWRWLIDGETTADTILELPDMPFEDEEFNERLTLDELGFGPVGSPSRTLASLASPSADFRKTVVSSWMAKGWPSLRSRIAREVHKVKHWELIEGDYQDAPDIEATWFIDPPYQKITHGYESDRTDINFADLAEWCLARRGQIIVCEESGADWLPFEPLTAKKTLNATDTLEVVYTNTTDNLLDLIGE